MLTPIFKGATKLLLEHGDRTGDLDLEEVEEWGTWTDRKNDQGTALYVAAREGHEDIVDVLREKGADPGFRDRIGRTAADVAEERGHRDLAKKLR